MICIGLILLILGVEIYLTEDFAIKFIHVNLNPL